MPFELPAPIQRNADKEWKEAFVNANATGRRVWVRLAQQYCGPCVKLDRWIDAHRGILEKDFVILRVDESYDEAGPEVAQRLLQGRNMGTPFHGMFTAEGTLIIDSVGPNGNVGYMSGIEGSRHFQAMLEISCRNITKQEQKLLLKSLQEPE